MRMRKFPLIAGSEYLLVVTDKDEQIRHVVGIWDGYMFYSLTDSNDEDHLNGCSIEEYLPL